jgi:hypothetical protein
MSDAMLLDKANAMVKDVKPEQYDVLIRWFHRAFRKSQWIQTEWHLQELLRDLGIKVTPARRGYWITNPYNNNES